ncbi:Hypothetical protein NTJ_07221 [Nesidiocoris tenuis]|uniref:Uncharacterized protein n=1 Tax=Nesidiocoris tenuis TaxID=355587 RepID=A0ABN7ASU4_9HEMI|nr:Hypothetical protein NTJ_07221 [Nesidiocoris tenuis]
MQKFAVISVLVAVFALSTGLSLPAPKTVDQAIAALNRGAAIGKAAINVALTTEIIKANLNLELDADQKACIRNGIQELRNATLTEIDTALNSISELVKSLPADSIESGWSGIKDLLFGDEDGIVGTIKQSVEDSIESLQDQCEDGKSED